MNAGADIQCYDGDGMDRGNLHVDRIVDLLGKVINQKVREGFNGRHAATMIQHLEDAQGYLRACYPTVTDDAYRQIDVIETFLRHYGIQVYDKDALFLVQTWIHQAYMIAGAAVKQ